MRNQLALILILASAVLKAQYIDERVEVVTLDSTRSAKDIYRTAERWFVDKFRDAQEVIQLRDTVTNTLVGKGNHTAFLTITEPTYSSTPWLVKFTIEVQAKDGRYRVRMYDVSSSGSPIPNTECCMPECDVTKYEGKGVQKTMGMWMPSYVAMCSDVKDALNGVFTSLHAAMTKAKDDW